MSPAQDALALKTRSPPAKAMTAPSLNIAANATSGAASATGAKPGQAAAAGNPLAGFEALMAAMFPAAQPGAATAPTTAAPFAPAADGQLVVEAKTDDAGEQDADADPAAAAETDAQGLVACMLATPQPTAEALLAAKAPSADGRPGLIPAGKGAAERFVPTLPGKAEAAPEAADAAPEAADAAAGFADPTGKAPTSAAKPADAAPPAWGRAKPPGAPAQPALDNASPNADLAAKAPAAEADAAEAPPAAPESAAPAPKTVADAANAPKAPLLGAKPEPTPLRAIRSERGKGASDSASADVLKPQEAVDRPVHAKAAEGAAKAASTTVEAVEPSEPREAKAEADGSDAAVQGETRSTASSTAPAAHATHQVRGSPETVANLAAQIIKKLEAKTTRFDLELDPHGLGRVDVRVEIGAHGKMTASMVFENPQAANELKARAAELQRTLEQAGFDLSGGLSFDVADQGARQQGQAWQDQADGGRAFRGQAFRAALETAGDAADAANHGALRLRRGVNAGVDVRI
jgi:Meckel syndrome type 1 protein